MSQHATWRKQRKSEAVYAREGLRYSVNLELCESLGSTNSSMQLWPYFWKEKADCRL